MCGRGKLLPATVAVEKERVGKARVGKATTTLSVKTKARAKETARKHASPNIVPEILSRVLQSNKLVVIEGHDLSNRRHFVSHAVWSSKGPVTNFIPARNATNRGCLRRKKINSSQQKRGFEMPQRCKACRGHGQGSTSIVNTSRNKVL